MSIRTALRTVLAVVSLSHLLLGLGAVIAPAGTVAQLAAAFYGAQLSLSPALHHLIRMLGAYMLAVGLMSLMAYLNPEKNQAVVIGVVALLLLRVLQRLVFAAEIHDAFNVSSNQLWAQSAFFLAIAIALIVFFPRKASAGQFSSGPH